MDDHEWVELNVWMRHGCTRCRYMDWIRPICPHISHHIDQIWCMNGGTNIHKSYMYQLFRVEREGFHGFWPLAIFSTRVFKGRARLGKPMGKTRLFKGYLSIASIRRFGTALRGGSRNRGPCFTSILPIPWCLDALMNEDGFFWNTCQISFGVTTLTCAHFTVFCEAGVGHFSAGIGEAACSDYIIFMHFLFFWWCFICWTGPERLGACSVSDRGGLPLWQAWAAKTSHLQGRAQGTQGHPGVSQVRHGLTRRRRSPPSCWKLRTQLRKMAAQFWGRSLEVSKSRSLEVSGCLQFHQISQVQVMRTGQSWKIFD